MKDIFIDNNVAKNFANPADPHYKELIEWLFEYNKDKENDAYMVVSNKLLKEYLDSSKNCSKPTSIPILISLLTIQGRLLKFDNQAIKEYLTDNFSKRILRNLRSNSEDHPHIATILMSNRKFAISIDDNLNYDLENYPGHSVNVKKRPEEIEYK